MEDIKVLVTKREGRRFWMAYYIDPISGKQKFRSTKTTNKRDADKFAGKWEDELRSGRFKAPSKITWEEFRDRFFDEHCPGLSDFTTAQYNVAFNKFERFTEIRLLRDANAETISTFQAKLREIGNSENTIASNLKHLKAALQWATDMELLSERPKVKMPKRVKGASMMKGRPITLEELERMIAKIPAVVGKADPAQWERLLWGFWYSGLRLGEGIDLFWGGNRGIVVRMDMRRPMMMIPESSDKSHKSRLLPITPDFAAYLETIPEQERRGRVFPVQHKRGGPTTKRDTIGGIIADIGTEAGVKVKDENGKLKFASAHDLRRAFGLRWSRKVMPAVLKELMRHDSINTTMQFYVGQDAESVADAVWEAGSLNSSMNTEQKTGDMAKQPSTQEGES